MSLEEKVETLLKGEGLEVTELHFAPEEKKPVTRKNACFAVCAVIFNSKVRSKSIHSAYLAWKTSYEIIIPKKKFGFPS